MQALPPPHTHTHPVQPEPKEPSSKDMEAHAAKTGPGKGKTRAPASSQLSPRHAPLPPLADRPSRLSALLRELPMRRRPQHPQQRGASSFQPASCDAPGRRSPTGPPLFCSCAAAAWKLSRRCLEKAPPSPRAEYFPRSATNPDRQHCRRRGRRPPARPALCRRRLPQPPQTSHERDHCHCPLTVPSVCARRRAC